ncbi:MAG: hypothetical protein GKR99_16685 [Rhodobacteraceae bacterium]|nr:hypothetical protein [Paracoccaceae bacterium]
MTRSLSWEYETLSSSVTIASRSGLFLAISWNSLPTQELCADCVEKLRNQSVADFLRKPMKRNSRKALTTRQRMAARERM